MAAVEISKMVLPDGTEVTFKDTTARQGGGGSVVAAVSINTPSSELYGKPITVTDSSGALTASTSFSESGGAFITLTKLDTYTFTVTY